MSRRILVVDDDAAMRVTLEYSLTTAGYEVESASSAEEALGRLSAFGPDVLITDVQMDGMSGLELLHHVSELAGGVDTIVITGYEDMRSAIGAIQEGAYDYLVKPIELDHLELVLRRCFRDRAARRRVQEGADAERARGPELAVGRSPAMIEIYKLIGMLSSTRAPVLIRGETGTGKELVARAIHNYSPWAAEPFIAVNCTALAESLLESELFGHTKGSFTGAVSDRKGRFELAGAGTIFLDEIGDTSLAFQAKLLRVLQEREFYPVGGERPRRTQARVVAATHRPVEDLIKEGKFREDLYFRLRVVEIRIPPLRERRTDIPVLAEHLLARARAELRKEVHTIPAPVMKLLEEYDWPGNVREMENAIMRAVVLSRGPALRAEDFSLAARAAPQVFGALADAPEGVTLDEVERLHVLRTLESHGGNKSQTARVLGISRPRLDRILARQEEAVAGAG